jgi:hypothetical protein
MIINKEELIEKAKKNFREYRDQNPRDSIHEDLKDFLAYAKKVYETEEDVNWNYSSNLDEKMQEVRFYVADCSELLLLFKIYLLENPEVKKE